MNIGKWLDGVFESGDYGSRGKVLRDLKLIVEKRERFLAEELYNHGPDYLKNKIEAQGGDFGKIYDALIFNQNVLKSIVLAHMDFFADLVAQNGPNVMRRVFKIEDVKYDGVFEELFDVVAVSGGGLYRYVYKNEAFLTGRIKDGGTFRLREDLGMKNAKYDELWLEIVDMLLSRFCEDYSDDRVIENGIMSLTMMLNATRQHRSLRSFSKMWEFSAVEE